MINKENAAYLQDKYVELESFFLKIEEGLFYKEELQEILQKLEKEIQEKFSKEGDEYRIWENCVRNRTIYKTIPPPGQRKALAGNDEIAEIKEKMRAIRKILERNSKDVLKNEIIFSSQRQYSAKRYILKILKSANKKIVIIDEYLDSTVLDLLDDINNEVDIQMLTGNPKSVFKSLLVSFKRSRKLAAKSSKYIDSSHSRYIIIDETRYYHLGASINVVDAGNMKSFSIQRIIEENVINDLNTNFKDWWDKGNSIE